MILILYFKSNKKFTYHKEHADCKLRNQFQLRRSHHLRLREMGLCRSGLESFWLHRLGPYLYSFSSKLTMDRSLSSHRGYLHKNQGNHIICNKIYPSILIIDILWRKYQRSHTSNWLFLANKVPLFVTSSIAPFVVPILARIGMNLETIFVTTLVIWLIRVPIVVVKSGAINPSESVVRTLATNPSCVHCIWAALVCVRLLTSYKICLVLGVN